MHTYRPERDDYIRTLQYVGIDQKATLRVQVPKYTVSTQNPKITTPEIDILYTP